MFSVILYMLRQTVGHHAPPLLFPSFPPLTVTFPKLAVILRPLYSLLPFISLLIWILYKQKETERMRNYTAMIFIIFRHTASSLGSHIRFNA
jgi:hypothetical protein